MDDFLTPISTVRTSRNHNDTGPSREASGSGNKPKPQNAPVSPEDALDALKHEPDYDSLVSVLRFLSKHESPGLGSASIKTPSALNARLVQVLVEDIVPNYWALLLEDAQHGKDSGLRLLLNCLSSTTGINATLLRLNALIEEGKSETTNKAKRPDISLNLRVYLDLLSRLLDGDGRITEAWQVATAAQDGPARVRPRVQQILRTFGSGRIISVAAEAEELAAASDPKKAAVKIWPADSLQYTLWLGRNIVTWQLSDLAVKEPKFGSEIFIKARSLGHYDALVKQILSELVLRKGADPTRLGSLLNNLPPTEQRKLLFTVLKLLSVEYLDHLGRCESEGSKPLVSAVSGALNSMLGAEENNGRTHLLEWLTGSSAAGLGEGVGIRRAVLAVVSQHRDDIVAVLEKSLSQFGDQLYIKHSPLLQQEAHAQVLLLSAGYVHRKSPIKLTMLLRSSVWLNAISNRLGASDQRARFLGMVVGEGLSALVDNAEKRLNFKMEETEEDEGRWYKDLTGVSDEIGSLEPLLKPHVEVPQRKLEDSRKPLRKPATQAPRTGFIIEELSDEEASAEEDDIVPYAKPDSDKEDSDDDPTLVRRDKPKAPVYIRDLIRYLRDTDSYDHQKLALETAPALIRRKANYGTEVSEHAEELATLLVGLSDRFDMDNFDELRAQGMLAIVVAKSQMMGQWFAKTFFDGDYSISQRASILVVLGLGARELAGFEASDYAAAAAFPSKTLPERVERLYLGDSASASRQQSSSSLIPLPPNALDGIAGSLTSSFLAPLAARTADARTGPDVLKLSTFTSRLQEEEQQQQRQQALSNPKITKHKSLTKARVRSIPNTTAHLIYTSFFSPLAARFQAALHASRSSRGVLFHPYLLALYLKTLALLVHAAGPSTLSLPQMTAELWRLLLGTSVRAVAVGDLAVTRALLFGFMALLEVNEGRMRDVCQELGREVVETEAWVAGVFEGLRGGDEGGEEEGVKMLAAGVLVRLREGVEKYQMMLVGDLVGFG